MPEPIGLAMLSCGRTELAVSTQLIEHRLRARLSQEELAERAQFSVRALRNIERGRTRYPYLDSIRRLAIALHLNTDETNELLSSVARPLAGRR